MTTIKIRFNDILRIQAKTIKLYAPVITKDNKVERAAEIQDEKLKKLILSETFLRRSAYKNTSIQTNESFFDDSDMQSEYYLVVIYDKKTNIPLLSARYYFDRALIVKYLKGDNDQDGKSMDLKKIEGGELFLIDRLSGNISSSVYRKCRSYIFLLFYSEILNYNRNCNLILMARSEKQEKLLKKYLGLGFNVVGSAMHKGKEHWILFGNLKKAYSQTKFPIVAKIILMYRYLLSKLNTR